MTRVIIVDPDPRARDIIDARHPLLHGLLALTDDLAHAQELVQAASRSVVIVRHAAGPEGAAAAACGFDLAAGPGFVRLLMLSTPSRTRFVHEVDRLVAELSLPQEVAALKQVTGLPAEFPHGSYLPVARVGRARCSEIFLVRNRIAGTKELLVQVDEDAFGALDVATALYRNFDSRSALQGLLRHELTGDHSYIAAGALPFDFAHEVDQAMRRAA